MIRYFSIFLCCLSMLALVGCKQDNQSVKALLSQGDKAFEDGEYKRAAYFFKQIKDRYPKAANVHISLGFTYLKLNYNSYAGGEFSKALELTSNTNALAWTGLGIYYARSKDWTTAIRCYSKALLYNPDESGTYRNFGTALFHNGEYSQAVAHFDHAQSLERPDAELANAIGLCHEKATQWDKAVKAYERAFEIDPKNSTTIYRLAVLYKDQFNNIHKTRKYYELLQKVDPNKAAKQEASFNFELANRTISNTAPIIVVDNPPINKGSLSLDPPKSEVERKREEAEREQINNANRVENLAKLNYEKSDYMAAIKKYLEVLKIAPDRGYNYRELALIYERKLNDLKVAITYFEKYLTWCNSQKDEVKFQTTVAYVNDLRAKYNSQEVEKRNSIQAEEKRILTEKLEKERQSEEARLARLAEAENKPHSYTDLITAGETSLRTKEYEHARNFFQQAIAINPNFPSAYYNIGLIELSRTNYMAAIQYFDEALDKDPKFASSHVALGAIYTVLKKKPEAIEHYTYYLELDPNGRHAPLAKRWLSTNAGAE